MGKIRLEINMGSDAVPRWETASLNKGTKINMSVVNPIFDREAKGTFSQMFSLNVEMNRHIFGNTESVHGKKVHSIVQGRKYKLSIEDVPFSWGVVHLSDEVDVEDEVEIDLVGNDKEWADIVKDMNCQDVKPMTESKLGWGVKYAWASPMIFEGSDIRGYKEVGANRPYDPNKHQRIEIPPLYMTSAIDADKKLPHQASGSGYAEDCSISNSYNNISQPYPISPFCNLRFCYQAQGLDKDNNWKALRRYGVFDPKGDYLLRNFSDKKEDNNWKGHKKFKYATAHLLSTRNFPHPPQFYVKYFLKSLFKQLGIAFDETAWNSVSDLNRLFFYNTNFGYDLKDNEYRSVAQFGRAPQYEVTEFKPFPNIPAYNIVKGHYTDLIVDDQLTSFDETQWWRERLGYIPFVTDTYNGNLDKNKVWLVKKYGDDGYGNTDENKFAIYANGYINFEGGTMIANGKNFPDKSIEECISSLENLLGMRMLYDSRRGRAEFVFLRDILSQEGFTDLGGIVSDMYPTYLDVRGFELTYSSASEDNRKAQQEKDEKFGDDFDMAYDYFDYENINRKSYEDIIGSVSAFDTRVAYDETTGDPYRFKIDKEEEQKADGNVCYYFPSTYEVAQFCHATEGDLSDEDYVEKIEIGVEPLTFNDIKGGDDEAYKRTPGQVFARFTDGEYSLGNGVTWSDRGMDLANQLQDYKTDFNIVLPMTFDENTAISIDDNKPYAKYYGRTVGIPVALSLYPYRRWDASASELPLIGRDKTFAVGLMRGGGSDGGIVITETNYDGEGHDLWVETVGTYASHFDTMDNYGRMFDNIGKEEGIGAQKDNLISLRLRAEKENPQWDPSKPSTDTCANGFPNTRFFPITNEWAKKRGIFDKLYSEYAHFTLNKSVMNFEIRNLTIAEILNIDLKKKYRKNNVIGWIKEYEYEIDDETGLGTVKLKMYYI